MTLTPTFLAYISSLKSKSLERKVPNISPEMGRYLYDMTRALTPQRVLEIGTANGYSTLWIASALSEWASITTIEQSVPAHAEACEYFHECGFDDRIHARLWDALEVIPTLTETYDLVFIDGYKRLTLDFFLAVIPHTHDRSVIIIDDVIKFRGKMESFFTFLNEKNIPHTILPIDPDDGCMMIVMDEEIREIQTPPNPLNEGEQYTII